MALFEAGAKQGQLDKIDTDLKQVPRAPMCTVLSDKDSMPSSLPTRSGNEKALFRCFP